MAFIGTPVVKRLGKGVIRISGVSLSAYSNEVPATVGTITLDGGGGDIELPAGFPPLGDPTVDLADYIECRFTVANGLITPAGSNIRVSKFSDVEARTLEIGFASIEEASDALDIYIEYFHSLTR